MRQDMKFWTERKPRFVVMNVHSSCMKLCTEGRTGYSGPLSLSFEEILKTNIQHNIKNNVVGTESSPG